METIKNGRVFIFLSTIQKLNVFYNLSTIHAIIFLSKLQQYHFKNVIHDFPVPLEFHALFMKSPDLLGMVAQCLDLQVFTVRYRARGILRAAFEPPEKKFPHRSLPELSAGERFPFPCVSPCAFLRSHFPAPPDFSPIIRYTGIADEAGNGLDTQIRATQELGWRHLEMRNVLVPGHAAGNVHDIPDEAFNTVRSALESAEVSVVAFGSSIGNWASKITDPFEITLERVSRAIPRMQALGTKFVRVMSYAILKDNEGRDLPDQQEEERFRRLREIKSRFDDAGLTAVHENCMNYGGMSVGHALRTLENVPGLRWVFDTGNPVFNADRGNPGHQQDSWDFYQAVKPAVSHIHIKDGHYNAAKKDCDYTLPGEGQGEVARILTDVLSSGYDGFLSIEPHTAVVFHSAAAAGTAADADSTAREQYQSYLTYGRALEKLVAGLSTPVPV